MKALKLNFLTLLIRYMMTFFKLCNRFPLNRGLAMLFVTGFKPWEFSSVIKSSAVSLSDG